MRWLLLLLVAGLVGGGGRMAAVPWKSSPDGSGRGLRSGGLKLLWTYDAGESIESSAAIAGQTVYVGVQSADLVAIDLDRASFAGSTAPRTG